MLSFLNLIYAMLPVVYEINNYNNSFNGKHYGKKQPCVKLLNNNNLFLQFCLWLFQLWNFTVSQIENDFETVNFLTQSWNRSWRATCCLSVSSATGSLQCWRGPSTGSVGLWLCLLTLCLLINIHHTATSVMVWTVTGPRLHMRLHRLI